MPDTGGQPGASAIAEHDLADIRAALAGRPTGAIDQANSGGANVANSGVIEHLTITLGAQPEAAPSSVFVVCADADRAFVETAILPALDPLPLRIRYAVNTAGHADAWEPLYRAMDRANLLLVVASNPAALRDAVVRSQVAYWLDSHPDTASVVVVSGSASLPQPADDRLARHPVVVWSHDVAGVRARTWSGRCGERRPSSPSPSPGPVTRSAALAPIRSAYLRWLGRCHATLEAVIAGRAVVRPLRSCPPPGDLVSDESHHGSRAVELAHLHARSDRRGSLLGDDGGPDAAELAALADRPLPTYLGSATHLDHLDLSGRPAISPDAILADVWRAIVLGDPGSGKSSLVRRLVTDLAAAAADDTAPDAAGGPVVRLPVLCRAADLITALDEHTLSAEGLAAAAISSGWAGQAPYDPGSGDPIAAADLARLARATVRDRRILLVVDGLDEVPTQAERRSLAEALDRFAAAGGARIDRPERAPGNQMLVTSRIAGYHSSPLGERFSQFLIGPLTPEGAGRIVDYWLVEAPDTPRDSALPGDAAAQRIRVNDLVRRPSLPVGEFATNPYLLVSLISASFTGWGSGRKPDGHRWVRADLYHLMVDDAIRRGLQRYPDVAPQFAVRLHGALAHRIHQRSRSGVVERDLLDSCVAEVLAELGPTGRSWDVASARQLVADTGLLVDRGQGLYGFRHLTVEEYLAARWLLARDPDPAGIAASVVELLADPRWLEALRLALGELSSTDRPAFDAVARALFDGSGRRAGAELLTTCLADLVTLEPGHVGELVAVAVETDRHDRAGSAATADAALLALLLGWPVTVQGRSCAVHVREALTRFITGGDPAAAAAAARLVDATQIEDRSVAEALFDAQERDGERHGWQLTRSLMSIQARRLTTVTASPAVELTDDDRSWLAEQEILLPPADKPQPRSALRGSGGLGDRLPMRRALELDPSLAARVLADVTWTRTVLCLYGGIAFLDTRRWQEAHREIVNAFDAPTTGDAERRRLAIVLDTVTEPALAARAERSIAFSVAHITGESPLTPLLIGLLRRGVDGAGLLAALAGWSTDPGLDDTARGDALAANLAVADPATSPVDVRAAAPVRERAAWRLGRAEVMFTDAVARLSPSAVVTSAASASPEAAADVVRAMRRLGHQPGTWGDGAQDHVVHAFGLLIFATVPDKTYQLAVALDTMGRAIGGDPDLLIGRLSLLHLSPAFGEQTGAGWLIDPFAPVVADLGEALSALWNIDPRLSFVRCWLLDRLAGALVDGGYAGEAMLCAAHVARADRVSALRTVTRIYEASRPRPSQVLAGDTPSTAGDADADAHRQETLVDAGALAADVQRLVDDAGHPYSRIRGRMRHAAQLGAVWGAVRLAEVLAPVEDAWQRMRLFDLAVELRLADSDDGLLDAATATARQIDILVEQARALARLSRWTTGQRAEDLRVAAVAALNGAHPDDAAPLLAALGPAIVSAAGQAVWRQYVDALPLLRQRQLATGDAAGLLLGHEAGPAADAGSGPDAAADDRPAEVQVELLPWAVLSGAVLCRAGRESLRRAGDAPPNEAQAWPALADPARRGAATAVLREAAARREGATPLQLTDVAIAGIDALFGGGLYDEAAELLILCSSVGRDERLHTWRTFDGLAGEVATLLLIESGRLDLAAIGRLASLLTHHDDRIRLRTRLAIAPVNNFGEGRPRLRASALGAPALTAFVRLAADLRARLAHFYTDVMWALTEIVHDSADVLITTLAALDRDDAARRLLLGSICQPGRQVFDRLGEILAPLAEGDVCHLLYGLQCAAANPVRYGVQVDQLRRIVPVIESLLGASGTAAARDCLRLLGHILPAERASVGLLLDEAAADDEVADAACEAVGFVFDRGPVDGWELDPAQHSRLMAFATGPDAQVAAAALGALTRGGVLIESLDQVPAYTITRGLMAATDPYLVGEQQRRSIRRAGSFVLAPLRHHDDQTPLADRLIDDVMAWLTGHLERCRSGGARRVAAGEPVMPEDTPLLVLAEIARRQPAAVREAARLRAPHLPDRLVEVIDIDHGWTTRLSAGVLLLCLGHADGPRLRAVVGLARDSSIVHAAVLSVVPWLDDVTDCGLVELVTATASAYLTEAHLAVQILGSVLQRAGLSPVQRKTALDAVAGAARRPDAERHVQVIHSGAVVSIGTLAGTCGRMLSALRDAPGVAAAATHTPHLVVHLRDAHGRPVPIALTAGVPTQEPIKHQVRYLQEAQSVEFVQDDIDRLNRIGDTVATAGGRMASVARALQP
ncbi:hypothetical protein ACFQZ4_04455 [Catellatospora coxensis]